MGLKVPPNNPILRFFPFSFISSNIVNVSKNADKIPNPNIQTPNNFQISNPNERNLPVLNFGN